MALYNCKSADGSYRITKFDTDLNPEGSYLVSDEACECPAGVRPTCRHRQMLPKFLARDAVDQPIYYAFEEDVWLEPVEAQLEDSAENDGDVHDDPMREEAAAEGLAEFNAADATAVIADVTNIIRDPIDAHIAEVERLATPEAMIDFGIAGVTATVLTPDNIGDLHNAIADAVGEPEAKIERVAATPAPAWRRF